MYFLNTLAFLPQILTAVHGSSQHHLQATALTIPTSPSPSPAAIKTVFVTVTLTLPPDSLTTKLSPTKSSFATPPAPGEAAYVARPTYTCTRPGPCTFNTTSWSANAASIGLSPSVTPSLAKTTQLPQFTLESVEKGNTTVPFVGHYTYTPRVSGSQSASDMHAATESSTSSNGTRSASSMSWALATCTSGSAVTATGSVVSAATATAIATATSSLTAETIRQGDVVAWAGMDNAIVKIVQGRSLPWLSSPPLQSKSAAKRVRVPWRGV
jgi:hypothetical protein